MIRRAVLFSCDVIVFPKYEETSPLVEELPARANSLLPGNRARIVLFQHIPLLVEELPAPVALNIQGPCRAPDGPMRALARKELHD